ncbi:MAG TPA: twin-arginine translocase TatA/TatE family subunit [Ktedonobacteraceae bacterium]|nr:twin-arginine translocase TatA/TatE family subunit [Ktedonobacteraceae bacterium]
MLGFHWFELLIIAGIGLILMGPKTMQSIARNAGKGVSQAKDVKEKVLAEIPEEVTQISQQLARVPLSPQQAVQMLMAPEKGPVSKKQKLERPQPKEDITPSA